MSRRKKDPLRALTARGAPGPDPAQPVAGRPGRRGRPGHAPPGRRRGDDYQARRPRRRPPLRRRRLPPGRPLQRRGPGRPDAPPRRRPAARLRPGGRGSGSSARPRGPRPPRPTAPRPGRCSPCGRRCARPPTACPRVSTYTLWQVLHEAGYSHQRTRTWCPTGTALRRRKAGRGGRHRPGRRAKKKLIEDAYRAGRGDGPVGLVHRPGRAVPDGPAPRPVLAARGRAGAPAARVPPRRHGQGPDAVPPGRRAGPPRGRDGLPQRGPAPLAASGSWPPSWPRCPAPPATGRAADGGARRPGSGGRRA